jgi:hypothetical protein
MDSVELQTMIDAIAKQTAGFEAAEAEKMRGPEGKPGIQGPPGPLQICE